MERTGPKTARPPDAKLWLVVAVAVHILVATAVAVYGAFPSTYDEIAHISFVKAMAEAPVLFPHYGSYRLLDAQNLGVWTSEPNYLAHPALYYLVMAPLWTLTGGSVLALRLADVALSAAGLALAAAAGAKLIEAPRTRLLFILLVFCFPKNPVIGGIVSNDNLVLVAAGLFLWGCASPSRRTLWLGLALALAGWTKLTALVGLGAAAGVLVVYEAWSQPGPRLRRGHAALALAVLVGLVPYLVNWTRTGHLLYVPENGFWTIPVAQRLTLDFWGFVAVFFGRIVEKFPAADRMMDDAWPLAGVVLVAFAALRAKGEGRARRVATGFLAALVIFVPIHLFYAWKTFLTFGQLSDAQPRYYNELWPGFALALALGCTALDGRRWPVVTIAVVVASLAPTALGLLIFSPPGI
ncbi:hypothetical protein [Beijerinckia sp. L45]|uniref:hypothetical protein n=1 Tax=Beijerinckia sp. L45 TaxID=1641855 RepID=UPI00131CC8E0|nr:hypothetical protein [Beijerinckia sp. L45]